MKRSSLSLFLVAACAAAVLVIWPTGAQAQAPAPRPTPSDDQVNAVAHQLYCPVCENIPLDVCPTQACAQWRDLIRQKLAAGWSDQQIKDYFATQYGERVLAVPPQHGLNWLVYILPLAMFLAGGGLLFFVLRGMRRRATAPRSTRADPQASPPPAELVDEEPVDEYMLRLEEELRKRESS